MDLDRDGNAREHAPGSLWKAATSREEKLARQVRFFQLDLAAYDADLAAAVAEVTRKIQFGPVPKPEQIAALLEPLKAERAAAREALAQAQADYHALRVPRSEPKESKSQQAARAALSAITNTP